MRARACAAPSHLEEVGELVLHQLSQLAPAERAIPALPGGVAVEDGDERLHGGLQFRRHGGCCVAELQGGNRRMVNRIDFGQAEFDPLLMTLSAAGVGSKK